MKHVLMILLIVFSFSKAFSQETQTPQMAWGDFDQFMQKKDEQESLQGLSLMVSGGLAVVAGTNGYFSASSSVSRSFFAIAQTVGVLSLGYGAKHYWTGNDYQSFYLAVKNSNLTPEQRGEVLNQFLKYEREKLQQHRWIQVGTHSLIAALNFYTAAREEDSSVKNLLNVIAVSNIVLGLSFVF